MDHFIDALIAAGEKKSSRVIASLSPNLSMIPESIKSSYESVGGILFAYAINFINSVKDSVAGINFDVSAFSLYGLDGMMAMTMAAKYAKQECLAAIIDGDFGGDIEKIANGYLATLYNPEDQKFYADAITLSPYNDAQKLKKVAEICQDEGKACFITLRTTKSKDKENLENIVTKDDNEPLYKSATDDSGAFGEKYIGEKGYSVLGMVTFPDVVNVELRNINRWGLALVKASVRDLDDNSTYSFFYEGEGEGEFVVISDVELLSSLDLTEADFEGFGNLIKSCVRKVEEKRLAR